MAFIRVERIHPGTAKPQGQMWVNVDAIALWFYNNEEQQMTIVLTNGLAYRSSSTEDDMISKVIAAL